MRTSFGTAYAGGMLPGTSGSPVRKMASGRLLRYALKERLTTSGATLIEPLRPTPFARFFFRDPHGYMFEVVEEEPDEPRPLD
jgi:predicted enzyme related to lactoylglutathione lyase